ncbi:hypothetical protein LTR95_019108 [Oleoguttula sp. CCFEE 5521]
MSKLSEPLKALINAAHARPHTTPAPRSITSVYQKVATDAAAKQVGLSAWLCASTAVTMTLNSPDSLLSLYTLASSPDHQASSQSSSDSTHALWTAELMRETGLKCIGFNGVPRTINMLNAFHSGLPKPVQSALAERKPRRNLSTSNLDATLERGRGLWSSIYRGFDEKLVAKLAQSHPDLPVHIIESEYGALFSDPPSDSSPSIPNVGRVLTSIVAVSCLRAQTGVGPQVLSHVFGLRKAFSDGTAEDESEVQGGKWLAGDEGSGWLLRVVDEIVGAIGEGRGGTFAPGFGEGKEKAKL